MKPGYVYILINRKRPTLYIGMTGNLPKRLWEHQNDVVNGFCRKYNVKELVYYECLDSINQAVIRERQLKKMSRQDKLNLIKSNNPGFQDLSCTVVY